jgi:putative DNA primase/helicase
MHAAKLARNRWPDLLIHFGIDQKLLTGKHSPCPACGGRDRFRFDDMDGRGTFFCSHCGSGDGFALLGLVKGWAFKQVAAEVERIVGIIPVAAPMRQPVEIDKLATCKRIWAESLTVVVGDPVQTYLQRRTGIIEIPAAIRFHPHLSYRHDDGALTRHPAMVTKATDMNGHGTAIHRTYLTLDGHKANVPTAKKVVGSLPPSSAIRLLPTGSSLGIAEGIETALSASVMFGTPVWAAISAGGFEKWAPPIGIQHVTVFGDNDTNGTGQAASWSLAKRLIASGIAVDVKIPETPGHDWNDIYRQGI